MTILAKNDKKTSNRFLTIIITYKNFDCVLIRKPTIEKKNTIKDGRKQVLIKQYESLVILTKLPYII